MEEYNKWVKSLTIGDCFRYKRRFGKDYVIDRIVKVSKSGKLISERGHEIDADGKVSFFGLGFQIQPIEKGTVSKGSAKLTFVDENKDHHMLH